MPRFRQVTDGHIRAATDILVNVREDVYAPLKPVTLCPVCSGLASLQQVLEKRKIVDAEEIINARDAAGTCLVIGEIANQVSDMLANVEDIVSRDSRSKLLEIDLCVGSLHQLSQSAEEKMSHLIGVLGFLATADSAVQVNWGEYTTWLCGVLLSLYCIQKEKTWTRLVQRTDRTLNFDSLIADVSLNGSAAVPADGAETVKESHELALKLVRTTLVQEMLQFNEHLTKVKSQLAEISATLRDCQVNDLPKPVPYQVVQS